MRYQLECAARAVVRAPRRGGTYDTYRDTLDTVDPRQPSRSREAAPSRGGSQQRAGQRRRAGGGNQ